MLSIRSLLGPNVGLTTKYCFSRCPASSENLAKAFFSRPFLKLDIHLEKSSLAMVLSSDICMVIADNISTVYHFLVPCGHHCLYSECHASVIADIDQVKLQLACCWCKCLVLMTITVRSALSWQEHRWQLRQTWAMDIGQTVGGPYYQQQSWETRVYKNAEFVPEHVDIAVCIVHTMTAVMSPILWVEATGKTKSLSLPRPENALLLSAS